MRYSIYLLALTAIILSVACESNKTSPNTTPQSPVAPGPDLAPSRPADPDVTAPAPMTLDGGDQAGADGLAPPAEEATPAPAPRSRKKEALLLSPNAPKGGEGVVAWSDSARITREEFTLYLNRLPVFQQKEYSSLQKKRDLLEHLITFEALAAAALADGFADDPAVRLAYKAEMVSRFLEARFGAGAPVNVTDQDIQARYNEQLKRFNMPARIRTSQILVTEKATAEAILQELRSLLAEAGTDTRRVFRQFVEKHSEDKLTAKHGGDLQFFTREGERNTGPSLDQTLAQAAFAMQNIGQISSLIKTDEGYHILLLTNRRDAINKPLETVADEVRRELEQEQRDALRKQFMKKLLNIDDWHIETQVLDTVTVDSAPSRVDVNARVKSIKSTAEKGAKKSAPDKTTPPDTTETGNGK